MSEERRLWNWEGFAHAMIGYFIGLLVGAYIGVGWRDRDLHRALRQPVSAEEKVRMIEVIVGGGK